MVPSRNPNKQVEFIILFSSPCLSFSMCIAITTQNHSIPFSKQNYILYMARHKPCASVMEFLPLFKNTTCTIYNTFHVSPSIHNTVSVKRNNISRVSDDQIRVVIKIKKRSANRRYNNPSGFVGSK